MKRVSSTFFPTPNGGFTEADGGFSEADGGFTEAAIQNPLLGCLKSEGAAFSNLIAPQARELRGHEQRLEQALVAPDGRPQRLGSPSVAGS